MKSLSVVFVIGLIGLVFLVGGVGATVNRTLTTATCEACGMEVVKDDISTFKVVSSDGNEHWACCPVCADVVGLYYKDAVIEGQCFSCGKSIGIHVENMQMTYLDFSGNKEFIKMVAGGSCMKNKLVCSSACSQSVHQSYDWAASVPDKTLQETLMMGNTKLQTMTVGYKPATLPALNFVLIGIGVALLVAAPISWKIMNKNPKVAKTE